MSTSIGRGVSQALGLAAFESSHLPPSAVLFVRRLRDPLPRRLLSSQRGVAPSAEWEVAMRGALDRCAREAARPALEPVPGNANAVLFADQGELLACLARDLLTGEAALRWWWVAMRRSLPPGAFDALVAVWCRHAAAVPAALDILTRTGTVERVLAGLTPPQALTVVRAVAAAFEIPALLTLLARDHRAEPESTGASQTAKVGSSPASSPRVAPAAVSPPWVPLIHDSRLPPALGVERQLLLGVGLTLARAPTIARSRGFVECVATWWIDARARPAGDVAEPQRAATAASELQTTATPGRTVAAEIHESPPRAGLANNAIPEHAAEILPESPIKPAGNVSAVAPTQRPGRKETKSPSGPSSPASSESPPTSVTPFQPGDFDRVTTSPQRAVPDVEGKPRAVGTAAIEPPATERTDQAHGREPSWIGTELGGTFYLVTLLTRLDFFDSLERHFGLTTPLGGWSWIELFARVLLRERVENHLADPVWRCLAALDGRKPGIEIGRSFLGADVYLLPSAWAPHLFTPAELATARWLSRGRVQLWHPQGVALRRDLGPVGLVLAPELRRFLEFLVPFLRWRIARAMRLERDSAISGTLLESAARVSVSATHVDVRFPLEAARPAVRLAGLDANPGWVPPLGRIVSFEFV